MFKVGGVWRIGFVKTPAVLNMFGKREECVHADEDGVMNAITKSVEVHKVSLRVGR
jgi:hypothetical protein